MEKPKIKLYKVRKDVQCVKCNCKGAVQSYGAWCPSGLGDAVGESKALKTYKDTPFMDNTMGFGGTIPYECLNCGNAGLVDVDGFEGYKLAFVTIK